MSEFAFIFSLYSLVLSFSLIELLSGLGKAIEETLRPSSASGKRLRVGWLIPLLGIFLLLDLLSFWSAAWVIRDILEVSGLTLMSVLLFAGTYYLAAYMIFPSNPADHEDLDNHYFRIRRVVLGMLLALTFCQLGFYAVQPAIAANLASPLAIAMTLILISLMVAAMLFKNTKVNMIILVALIARYLIVYII